MAATMRSLAQENCYALLQMLMIKSTLDMGGTFYDWIKCTYQWYKVGSKFFYSADYSKDLLSYLKYCTDVVFPGITYSVVEEHLIEIFRHMYKGREDENPKAHMEEIRTTNVVNKCCRDGTYVGARCFSASSGNDALQRIKSEMEDHGFYNMLPRK